VEVTQAVLEQALRYHSVLKPKFLMLSNGSVTYCFKAERQGLQPLDHLPDFAEINAGTVVASN
jgi:hypothetical protein